MRQPTKLVDPKSDKIVVAGPVKVIVALYAELLIMQSAVKGDVKKPMVALFPESYEELEKQIAELAFETPLERLPR